MNLSEYQLKAARTMKTENSFEDQLIEMCLGLAGETGELIDHIKKHVYHGHKLDRKYLKKELGDILWYASGFATACNESMDEVADDNIKKLMNRYPEGFSEEMSRNRVEYD